MTSAPEPSSEGARVAVVTGANSGIGLETARGLAARGFDLVVTGRRRDALESAARSLSAESGRRVDTVVFDFADLEDVERGAKEILDRCDRIDVLVNNAGLVLTSRSETRQGFESTFGINHLAPFLLTARLRDRVTATPGARIVNVASTAHKGARGGLDFDDLQMTGNYRGMLAYSRSKLANILFTAELARRLEGTGVTANSVHPGTVATGFARDGDASGFLAFGIKVIKPFIKTPEKGARTSIYVATSPDVEGRTGGYYVNSGLRSPSKAARDPEAAARLWAESERMVGLA